MAATLRLTREGFGIELRRGTFDITVDGTKAGSIQWHETVEVPVEPGHHTLQIRAGRYSSREVRRLVNLLVNCARKPFGRPCAFTCAIGADSATLALPSRI